MGLTILSGAAILGFVIIALRREPDRGIAANRQAKWPLFAALVLMGIYALFWLVFGIAEIAGGDWSGVIHLVPSLMLAVLMFLAWRRPVEGGVVLVILGVLTSLYYLYAALEGGRTFEAGLLLGGVPYLVFGALFLAAAALARRR